MSGYQYNHGQWPPPPPPQFAQYEYPPSSIPPQQYSYLAPSGQLPPSQAPPHQGYYGAAQASQDAFDHNAQAPGLGIGVDPVGSRSPNAVGGDLSWSEAFGVVPAAAAPSSSYNPTVSSYQQPKHYQNSMSRTPTSYQQQQQQQQHYGQQHYQQPPPPPPQPSQQMQQPIYSAPSYPSIEQGQASEEGELSEDMDDVYDPEEPSDPALYTTAHPPSSTSSQDVPAEPVEAYLQPVSPEMPGTALGQAAVDMPSRDVSVIDTQDDAFYEDDDEPGEIKSTGNGVSASDAADADVEDMDYSDSSASKSLAAASGEAVQGRALSYSPRLSPGEIRDDQDANSSGPSSAAIGHQAVQKPPSSSTGLAYTTVDEAKKEAQRAILRLIRYDVNYQTFVDEGVDDKLVKSLFTELGLKIDSSKTPEGSLRTASPAVQAVTQAPVPSTEAAASASQAPASNPPSSAADDSASKKEERKDRIARLLALKASKTALSPAPAPVPAPASLPARPPAALIAKPDTIKSEKARLLQQKLEALKQAQEKRATAAAQAAKEAATLGQAVSTSLENRVPTTSPLTAPPTIATDSSTPLPASMPTAVIPVNFRKRPVAADFADFAGAQANAYKRPFGIARQDSTLVIDVSDDEDSQSGHNGDSFGNGDDDDDVEMEIESLADETVSHVPGLRGGNGTQSRDQPIPPAYSRFASNGQTTPVPPTAPASMIARAKDDEYTRKMRQIEEMKRKIAEAEAKKQRGISTGSVTPVTGGHGTPPEASSSSRNFDASQIVRPPPQPMRRITSTGELSVQDSNVVSVSSSPIRLPKRGDTRPSPSPLSSHGSLKEDRARAASLQLPRVEASLQEKMFKLRLLQDKVTALQAEINDGNAEKRRLTEDLEDLATDSDAPAATAPPAGNATSPDNAIVVEDDVVVVDSPAPQQSVEEVVQQPVVQPVLDALPQDNVAVASEPVSVDVDMDTAGSVAEPSNETAEKTVADPIADEYEPMLANGEHGSESAPMSVASSPPYEPSAEAEDVQLEVPAESGEDGEIVEDDDDNEDEEEEEEEDDEDEDEDEDEEDDEDEDEDMMVEDDGEALIIDDGETSDAARAPAVADAEAEAVRVVEAAVSPVPAVLKASAAAAPASAPVPAPSDSTFTPYDSPLQYFRSYRFHPQYKAQVAGGLKSLTYSGKIRDDIQLCLAESEGQDCSNPACPFQHFASIMPQDDQILVELGRSDEYTGEQQARFVDGLKTVLRKVREDQVRDFDTIADAIIEFRRTFLADETRILANLEGTSL
ncbi:hypothetical protein F503_00910 [Ophiostoma piceae UAMH 11346]|uniref:Zinc-finger domain-containing protein n=1 Tax=Ophiostoma piceae (strain UAMH 11346) TaxID=1262450 RepID=S3C5Q8_OPHP1|nr:hypothetical protein F503_00910 [Ophiostoma piceae UAMH 11346]